jgi:hypothetical protein
MGAEDNDHANKPSNYTSQILIVSDKRDRSESCHLTKSNKSPHYDISGI